MPSRLLSEPILRTCWIWSRKSSKVKVALAQLLLQLPRLLLVDGALGLLDEREHVAHAQDARGHAVGMEVLEVVELLAAAGELDGLAGDRPHGEGGAAAGVAVHLGEDDAVELHLLLELQGHVDRVLAGHGVEHQQDVVRLDRVADAHQLVHELLVDVQAAGGVDDEHVAPLAPRPLHPVLGDVHRVGLGALVVDRHAQLLAQGSSAGRRRPGGRRRRPPGPGSCPARAGSWPACRRRWSCPSPAGPPS